jgi:hypothetical protein
VNAGEVLRALGKLDARTLERSICQQQGQLGFPYQPSGKPADISLVFNNRHQLFEIVHMLIADLDQS